MIPNLVAPARWNHSFSSIKTFAEICELRYAIEKLTPWEDSAASLRGSHIHNALEAWAKLGFAPEHLSTALQVPGSLSEEELARWVGRTQNVVDHLTPIEAEFWLRTPLDGCKRQLVGKVDLRAIHDEYGEMLLDWKSVGNMRKKLTQTECDRSLQGRIYCKVTGIPRIGFVYFTDNHEAEMVTSEYSDQELADAWEFVTHTCQQIERRWETGHWRKSFPGGLCSPQWCGAYESCYPRIGAGGEQPTVADGGA